MIARAGALLDIQDIRQCKGHARVKAGNSKLWFSFRRIEIFLASNESSYIESFSCLSSSAGAKRNEEMRITSGETCVK